MASNGNGAEKAPSVSKQLSRMMSSDGKTVGDRRREKEAADKAAADKAAAKKAAAAKTPEKVLTPQDIVGVLEGRGWEASIVMSDNVTGLVDVKPEGIMRCVDGRGSNNTTTGQQNNGPKMLGGVYGIANNRGITSLDQLKGICQEVKKAGHVPSVHGDAGGMLGCGFCKLWIQGKFEDLGCTKPDFDADQGGETVKKEGGVVEMMYGSHAEKIVYINFVPDKTFEPQHEDQRFIVDAWAAAKFNLDIPKYLVTAAATVERLGGPKKAVLIVPSAKTAKKIEAKVEKEVEKALAPAAASDASSAGISAALIAGAAAVAVGVAAAMAGSKKEAAAPEPKGKRR